MVVGRLLCCWVSVTFGFGVVYGEATPVSTQELHFEGDSGGSKISLHVYVEWWQGPSDVEWWFCDKSPTSWWLNQPIWKICDRQIGSFSQGSGWKYKKKWNHQLANAFKHLQNHTDHLPSLKFNIYTPWKVIETQQASSLPTIIPIGSMGLVYLPYMNGSFLWFSCVGKYTIPMDPSWDFSGVKSHVKLRGWQVDLCPKKPMRCVHIAASNTSVMMLDSKPSTIYNHWFLIDWFPMVSRLFNHLFPLDFWQNSNPRG